MTTPEGAATGWPARWKVALHAVLLLHAAVWILWLAYVFALAPTPPERDWYALREVASSFVSGDLGAVYADRELEGGTHFFRYPPFVLYAIAPLALVPPLVAYAGLCIVQLGAVGAALVLLFRLARPEPTDVVVAAVLGSAALSHVIIIGQNSALLTLVVAGAAVALASGRHLLAGLLVGLLLAKPNWLPPFAFLVLARGGVRAGLGIGITCGVLLLSTLPLGTSVWADFWTVTTRASEIGTRYLAYKEITLLAFLKSVLGSGVARNAIWGAGILGGVFLLVRTLRSRRSFGRQVAATTLFAVVANPYASFYDGLVLVVPGVVWASHASEYDPAIWRATGVVVALYWLWDMAAFYYLPFAGIVLPSLGEPSLSLAGALVFTWLVLETR